MVSQGLPRGASEELLKLREAARIYKSKILSDADQVTMSEYLNSVLDAYKAGKIEREKEGSVKPSAALSRSGLKAKGDGNKENDEIL